MGDLERRVHARRVAENRATLPFTHGPAARQTYGREAECSSSSISPL